MIKVFIVLCVASLSTVFAKNIEINLAEQTLIATDNGKEFLVSNICSGKPGHETPRGEYKILEKEKMHISNLYPIKDKKANIRGGAKMPYMLRVTNSGIAIHAGEMVNYPDSHGCIRIPYGKAMTLFKWTDVGTKIMIVGKTPYTDEINKMRIHLLKTKKYTKRKKSIHKKYKKLATPVKWVEDYLDYYDTI